MTPLEALASSLAGRPVDVRTDRRSATTTSGSDVIRLGDDLDGHEAERLAAHAVLLARNVPATIVMAGAQGDEARRLALDELRRVADSRPTEISRPLVRALSTTDPSPAWLGDPAPRRRADRTAARRRLAEHSDLALSLGIFGKLAARLGGGRATSASGAGVDGAAGLTSVSVDDPPPLTRRIVSTGGADAPNSRFIEDHVVLLPEWDERAERLRHDHCAVHVAPRRATGPALPLRSADVRRMQRALRPLTRGVGPPHRDLAGPELDVDAVVRHRVDVRAGWDDGRQEALWRARGRTAPQVVLLTLVDHSGSGGDDEGALLRAVAQATTTWLAAAADLGIASSAFTFRSHGRSSVQLTPVQRDGHRLGSAGRALLADPERSGFTRLGAVLRYGTRRLTSRAAGLRRVVLLASDGFAFDEGYRGRNAEADVERALTEAANAHVGVVWVHPRDVEPAAERTLGHLPRVVDTEITARPELLTEAVLRAVRTKGTS